MAREKTCEFGKLKNPIGKRICRKRRPSRGARGTVTSCKAQVLKKMRAEIKRKVATCRRTTKKKVAAEKYAARFRPYNP